MNKLTVKLKWITCSADMGQFRQQSQLFHPEDAIVAVDLDATKENIYNFDDWSKWQEERINYELGQGDKPKTDEVHPILTVDGAVAVRNYIQSIFTTREVWETESVTNKDDTVSWDSDEDDGSWE